MPAMVPPYEAEFLRLVRLGAGARDIHGLPLEVGFAARTPASEAFAARELARVETHRKGACALLETFVGASRRVLDVGCSTGGSTVAMALSPWLAPEVVVGVDPDPLSLRAAQVRARGHGLDRRRVAFVRTLPGRALPFPDGLFDLVTCVSVLEFLPTAAARRALVDEMKRVTRPGGHLYVATPSPLRLRDAHARRWLGDLLRREGFPWASPPWTLRAMVADCERVPIDAWVAARALERAGVAGAEVPGRVARALAWAQSWQKVLVRKPAA
jgi:SAM-dependent methyltransferase